jgi:hypothetical protein
MLYTTGMEHSPTSATATAVLAGYENGLARKAGDRVDEAPDSEKGRSRKPGRRSTRRSTN